MTLINKLKKGNHFQWIEVYSDSTNPGGHRVSPIDQLFPVMTIHVLPLQGFRESIAFEGSASRYLIAPHPYLHLIGLFDKLVPEIGMGYTDEELSAFPGTF